MEIIKRILNFFRPEKKKAREPWMTDKVIEITKQSISDFEKKADVIVESKVIGQKVKKPQTQLFRTQQLPGKIYNTGKTRFRIHGLISTGNKFKYDIERLI